MAFLPENIWKRRLESEYDEMRSTRYAFETNADKTEYTVSLRGKGYAKQGEAVVERDSHTIQILLLREFPYPGSVEVYWLTPIFHPNIREDDGRVCIQLVNDWSESTSVAGIVKALQHLLANPNPKDPLNKNAAKWFEENSFALTAKKKPRLV
ncbi:MAG: ubiquitin-conjugating enzyme E2 [Candidatus Norongarragalinales archaeon]